MSRSTHSQFSRKRSNSRLTACSMLAAAVGSLSSPAMLAGSGVLGFLAEDSIAQGDRSESQTKGDTLRLMSRGVSLDVEDQPLEDILNFLMDVTGADLEPAYLENDSFAEAGMDPGTLITLRVSGVAGITVLERVLKKAERIEAIGEEYTWQLTDIGTIECGPKSVLNENQRIELYDIADLVLAVPDFDNAPTFNSSGGGGGGGGASPFSGGSGNMTIESSADRAQRIIDLIESSVEPDQWAVAGGDGASLRVHGTTLVITAPDYIHRQIVGYNFWPANLHGMRSKGDRRWVTIKPDPSLRKGP